MTPLETAREYARRGWCPIPIPSCTKAPTAKGWQRLRIGEAEVARYFRGNCNVGVLLGAPSGWLIDIDLDHRLAVELADQFLPPTGAEFGRPSKPRSHRLYVVTAPVETLKRQAEEHGMLVELRSKGCQTVFPGSVHPSGEPIEWSSDGEPARVTPELLRAAVNALADEVERQLLPGPPANGAAEVADPAPDRNGAGSVIVIDRARKYLAKLPPAVSGQGGHNATFHAACVLVQGFDLERDDALGLLREWNQACQPPWSEKDLAHKIDGAIAAPGERGYLLHNGRPVSSPAQAASDAAPTDVAANDAPPEAPLTSGEPDPWPPPVADDAMHGLAGEIVRVIEPHSEADLMALLAQVLVAFGNVIGRGPYFRAESDRHFTSLFTCLVGNTSKGRKGTSWGHVCRLFAEVDPNWAGERIQGGLSSGEGLIWAVRDPIFKREAIKERGRVVDYQQVETDPGVSDKRLMVLESEFASVLKVAGREKNTLSAIIRQAWDSGNLRTLTKNTPANATGAHISIVGHITRAELRQLICETDLANGLANRFLWLCVRRSKLLPEGGSPPGAAMSALASQLREAVEFARSVERIERNDAARQMWHDVYPALSAGSPGLLGAATGRAEAQVMRLAMLYALLDHSPVIWPGHLLAGLAVWQYAEDSARYIFGSALGDPTADAVRRALQAAPDGMTRTEIRDLFGRHKGSDEINRALAELAEHGMARCKQIETDGRPTEVWLAA